MSSDLCQSVIVFAYSIDKYQPEVSQAKLFCLSVYSMNELLFYDIFIWNLWWVFTGFFFSKIEWVDAPQFSTASQAQPFESGGCAEFRSAQRPFMSSPLCHTSPHFLNI